MSELIDRGHRLAAELEALSKNYHVKSDDHTTLEWESACVEARVEFLANGKVIPRNLQDSPLLGQSGNRVRAALPDVSARVAEFYEEFSRVSAPNNSLQARRP